MEDALQATLLQGVLALGVRVSHHVPSVTDDADDADDADDVDDDDDDDDDVLGWRPTPTSERCCFLSFWDSLHSSRAH